MFTLNPQSGIPIYRQLMEQIKRMIASGQLKIGDSLPSVRELAISNAVNPMTISKAYSLLEAEGWLERQRGKAMTVAAHSSVKETKKERLERLQPLIEQVAMASGQLEITEDEVLKAVSSALKKERSK